MARLFLTALDLNTNELQNAVVQNLASAPTSPTPADGQVYYNTGDGKLYLRSGGSWVSLATGAGVSFGSVTAQTSYGLSSSDGSATTASRSDHVHGTPSLTSNAPSTQAVGDTAVVGTGTTPARDDHKHAMPSFGSVTAQTTFGASSGNGSSANIARADHTHGTPAHDNAAHSSINLSALAAPTADVSWGTYKITSLGTPSASTDAATKGYVDSVAQGLSVKASVRAATTTAGTLASSFENGDVIDGVTLATGDRILIKNQAAPAENGIYTVNASGAPTRATDMDSASEFAGAFTFVEEGSTLADTGWVCTTNPPVTVGSTAINWTQFSGAGTYTASNGVTLSGSDFQFAPLSTGGLQTASGGASVKLPTNSGLNTDSTGLYVGAGTGISVSAGNVSVDTASVVRKYAATLSTSATSYTVTHNLGTQDVVVSVYATASPYAEVYVDVEHTSTSTVTLRFSTAPSANAYRVVVHA